MFYTGRVLHSLAGNCNRIFRLNMGCLLFKWFGLTYIYNKVKILQLTSILNVTARYHKTFVQRATTLKPSATELFLWPTCSHYTRSKNCQWPAASRGWETTFYNFVVIQLGASPISISHANNWISAHWSCTMADSAIESQKEINGGKIVENVSNVKIYFELD